MPSQEQQPAKESTSRSVKIIHAGSDEKIKADSKNQCAERELEQRKLFKANRLKRVQPGRNGPIDKRGKPAIFCKKLTIMLIYRLIIMLDNDAKGHSKTIPKLIKNRMKALRKSNNSA